MINWTKVNLEKCIDELIILDDTGILPDGELRTAWESLGTEYSHLLPLWQLEKTVLWQYVLKIRKQK